MSTTTIQWKRIASFWVQGEPAGEPRPDGRVLPLKAMANKFRPISSWPEFCSQVRRLTTVQMYPRDPKRVDGTKPVSTWRQLVECAQAGRGPREPHDCPVKVDMWFYFSRPQHLMRKSSPAGPIPHTVKPDKDNLEKLILDVMTKAGWWTDDSRVCTGTPTKMYVAKDGKPGAMIVVSVIDDEQPELF